MGRDELNADRIEAETGWHLWRHVSGGDSWYARRPRSSPPKLIGPLPLAELLDAIGWPQ